MTITDITKKILVIGGSGFIGTSICEYLVREKIKVTAAVRTQPLYPVNGVKYVRTGDYNNYTEWAKLMQECFGVVFAAGLAHSKRSDGLADNIFQLNAYFPFELAKYAVHLNIPKFIFLSSIKVNGEVTEVGETFGHDSKPAPSDIYAQSKFYAEEKLKTLIGKKTEISMIRLPLVVGALAKGNVGLIQMLVRNRIPIPAANLNFNSRSIVLLKDLCNVVHHMLISKRNITGLHFIKHHKNFSSKELIQLISRLEKRQPVLFSMPLPLLKFILKVLRLERLRIQLFCNLEVVNSYHVPLSQIRKANTD